MLKFITTITIVFVKLVEYIKIVFDELTYEKIIFFVNKLLSYLQLVRFYTRIGFKKVYEVTGSSFGDYSHMLVWGGVGTRMEADVEHLLVKWCTRFIPKK